MNKTVRRSELSANNVQFLPIPFLFCKKKLVFQFFAKMPGRVLDLVAGRFEIYSMHV